MRTLAEAWAAFRARAIPRDMPPRRVRGIQLAFYAGASFAFEIVTGTGQAAPLPEDEAAAEQVLQGVDDELKAFARDGAAAHAREIES